MGRSVYYFTDSTELGGAEEALLLLLRHLDRERWQPTLLYNRGDAGDQLAERATRLGVETRPVEPLPLGLEGARALPRLARLLTREQPVVFHAHLNWPLAAKYALAAAVTARLPAVVATVQLFPARPIDRSNRLQERVLSLGVGRYIAVSRAIAAQMTADLGWPRRKIEVIHNGVDLAAALRPRSAALRREVAGEGDEFVFLTVARLAPQKALDDLLTAASTVPDARFAIAGAGPERSRLEAQARRLGVDERVHFLGHRADVPELLAAADAFVLPSLHEGSSLALLEAMAAGKPVVATAIPGSDELVVDGQSGLLVSPRDPDALARALRRVRSEPETRRRLAETAQARAARFSAATTAARVMVVYDELLAGRAT
jgi:glycosyltransferase involved in cell wall biosynthesis